MRHLDGGAPAPFAYWLGRICEEFPCYGPEDAYRAWLRAPSGLFEDIIETRAVVAMKGVIDRAQKPEDIPPTPLAEWVKDAIETIAQEEIDADKSADD